MSSAVKRSRHGRILLFVFLLVIAVIVGSGFFVYRRLQASARNAALAQLAAVADLKAGQIVKWQGERFEDAELIRNSPFLARRVQNLLTAPEDREARTEILTWMRALEKEGRYSRVLLLDAARAVRLAVPEEKNRLESEVTAAAAATLRSNQVAAVDLHAGVNTPGTINMALLAPLAAPGTTQPLAVILLEINPYDYLYPLIESWPMPSRTAETQLIRREGDEVVFLNELRHRKDTALKLRFPLNTPQLPAARIIRGEENITEGFDYRGVPVVFVARKIAGSPWFMVAKQDRSEIYAPVRRRALAVGCVTGALLVTAIFGVMLLWRQRERRHLQQELAMAERVAHIVKSANDIILLLDENWDIVEANDRAVEKYGYTCDELLRMNVRELRTPEALKSFEQQMKEVGTQGTVLETIHRRKDGTTFLIESSIRAVEIGGRRYYQGIIRDITERKHAEFELQRMSRLYAALSQINRAVARVQTQSELFHEVCRVLVEFGGFKLAWIGWHDVRTHTINPLAHCGDGGGYLQGATIFADDRPEAREPVAAAIRDGKTCVCDPLADDEAARFGLHAAASVPLRQEGGIRSAMTVYVGEAGGFGDKETQLLEEVAANVSFGMDHLDREARRHEAERWLTDKEERFRQMFTSMSSGVGVFYATKDGTDFIFRDLNPAGEAITRMSVRDVVGRPVTEVFPGLREMGLLEVFQRVWRTGVPEHFDAHLYHDEKLTFWAENYVYRLSTGEIVTVFDDVTESKQAETALRESEEQFRAMADFTYDWELWTGMDGRFRYISPSCLRITGYGAKKFQDDPGLFLRIIHPEDRALMAEHLTQEDMMSAPVSLDFRIITRAGEVRWLNHICQAVFRSDGACLGRRASNRDITERKQVEEALQQNEKYFRALIEGAADLILLLAADGTIKYASPSISSLLGYAPETVTGRDALQFVHPEDLAEVSRALADYVRTPNFTSKVEFRVRHRDGTWRTLAGVGRNALDDPVIAGLIVNLRDITERKQAEQALRQSDQFSREIISRATEGIIVYDREFRYVVWNRFMENLTGMSAADLLGKCAFDVFPHLRKQGVDRLLEHALQGETVSSPDFWFRIPGTGKEGWVSGTYGPHHDVNGNIIGVIGVVRDITERKKTEEERTRLFTAMEQAAEIVVVTDTDARILYVNPAFEKITGYTRQEVLGQNPHILKSGKQDAAFYQQLWDTLTRGDVWHGRFINKRKDGTLYEEEATISPVRDASGRVVNYIALKLDVTREVELQTQLNHVMKMEAVGRLAGGIAHDFNNLLNVIMGYSEIVLAKLDPAHALFKPISQIKKSGERAAALTRQLRAFSRKQTVEPQVLDLNTMITDLHAMLRRLVREDIEIVQTLAPDLGRIRADPTQIEQVIINLVVNAHDAMPQGGTLTIETGNIVIDQASAHPYPGAPPGEYVQLAIRDSGMGMTDDVKAHLFEPFFTTKETGKGTGLGLAGCYGAVKQNGGYISVESAVGQGTVFRICLPRVAAKTTRTAVTTGALPSGNETILLVEDDAAVRQLAEAILNDLGYQVLVAANGEEALRTAEQKKGAIHLLLTDVVMPQMNGHQLAEALRKRYSHLKVLFVSGYVSDAIARDGVPESGVAFLQKPYMPHSLARKVREALDSEKK